MNTLATLAAHVTPRSGRDEVSGVKEIEDGMIEVQVRVTVPPDKGKANKAVCKLIAKELSVPKSAVSVKRGDTSRHKLLEVEATQEAVDAWIAGLTRL